MSDLTHQISSSNYMPPPVNSGEGEEEEIQIEKVALAAVTLGETRLDSRAVIDNEVLGYTGNQTHLNPEFFERRIVLPTRCKGMQEASKSLMPP